MYFTRKHHQHRKIPITSSALWGYLLTTILVCLCSTVGECNQADVVWDRKAHDWQLPPSAEAKWAHSVQIHGMFLHIVRTSHTVSVSPLYIWSDRGYIHIMYCLYNFRIEIQKNNNTCTFPEIKQYYSSTLYPTMIKNLYQNYMKESPSKKAQNPPNHQNYTKN